MEIVVRLTRPSPADAWAWGWVIQLDGWPWDHSSRPERLHVAEADAADALAVLLDGLVEDQRREEEVSKCGK